MTVFENVFSIEKDFPYHRKIYQAKAFTKKLSGNKLNI